MGRAWAGTKKRTREPGSAGARSLCSLVERAGEARGTCRREPREWRAGDVSAPCPLRHLALSPPSPLPLLLHIYSPRPRFAPRPPGTNACKQRPCRIRAWPVGLRLVCSERSAAPPRPARACLERKGLPHRCPPASCPAGSSQLGDKTRVRAASWASALGCRGRRHRARARFYRSSGAPVLDR